MSEAGIVTYFSFFFAVFNCTYSKIIESNGIELQKLKAELHQVQQQNVQLAQSNTQMLAVCLAYFPHFDVSYVLYYIFVIKILLLGNINVLLFQQCRN